jgi:hypothetical protein
MGGSMDETETRSLAKKGYSDRYPDDTAVTATEVVRDVFGGSMAVIRSVEKNGNPNEELVYIYPDKTVRIFHTTEEMARFLESKARPTFIDAASNITFIAGIVFVFLIVATFAAGFLGNYYSKEALAALSGVLGTAAGFFFGSKRT